MLYSTLTHGGTGGVPPSHQVRAKVDERFAHTEGYDIVDSTQITTNQAFAVYGVCGTAHAIRPPTACGRGVRAKADAMFKLIDKDHR